MNFSVTICLLFIINCFFHFGRINTHQLLAFCLPLLANIFICLLYTKSPFMIINEFNTQPYMKSLSTCLNKMITDGYIEDFKVSDRGLESLNSGKWYRPDEIQVVNFFRFEGMSDPDDNAILYVITTNDGTKGTLIDGYGIYMDTKLSAFMKEVENIHKKITK